jgi:2-keto-4-pentenoate hydratase/2-oxohepta-3-ene-1,7-dioic acid hydratase in catechol pathway
MKLVTFRNASGAQRVGALLDGGARILDLQSSSHHHGTPCGSAFDNMLAFINAGAAALDAARELSQDPNPEDCLPLEDERQLLAPIPVPPQIRDGLGFEQHLLNTAEVVKRLYSLDDFTPRHKKMFELMRTRPFWYKCNRFSVAGTGVEIRWPKYSKMMDYETEMAAVIGRGGRDIAPDRARAHIFGYTIFNDFSARDVQADEMDMFGPCKSKDFDNGNIFGPCIVTADEFDPYSAEMVARVNGVERSRGNSSSMNFRFEDFIGEISTHETLHPGEIIGSGTVGGGSGLDQGTFLQSGDVVEIEIAGIGAIRNRVVA